MSAHGQLGASEWHGAKFDAGLDADKGAPVVIGQLYFATDTGIVYHSTDGSVWKEFAASIHNLTATTAPTANDDSGDGYLPGSIWIDLSNDKAYICKDASVGAAVWDEFAGDFGPQNNFSATAAPTVNDDSGDGYAPGSLWVDETNDAAYICLDASSGAAVWTEITQSAGGGGISQESVRATDEAGATISATTDPAIAHATEDFDDNTMHDNVTNNSRITVKRSGVVVISASVLVKASAQWSGHVKLSLFKNGSLLDVLGWRYINEAVDVDFRFNASYIDKCSSGDYYQLLIYQISDGNININGTVQDEHGYFAANVQY